MKKHFLRTIASIMTVILLLTAAPLSGFAEIEWPELHLPDFDFSNLFSTTAKAAESGTCGENLTWSLDNGTLTISGTGKMTDYIIDVMNNPSAAPPWLYKYYDIKTILGNFIIVKKSKLFFTKMLAIKNCGNYQNR